MGICTGPGRNSLLARGSLQGSSSETLNTGCTLSIEGGSSSLYANFPIFLRTVNGPKYLASNFFEGRLVRRFFTRRIT